MGYEKKDENEYEKEDVNEDEYEYVQKEYEYEEKDENEDEREDEYEYEYEYEDEMVNADSDGSEKLFSSKSVSTLGILGVCLSALTLFLVAFTFWRRMRKTDIPLSSIQDAVPANFEIGSYEKDVEERVAIVGSVI